jgi:uncharacterized membrane protein YbhN (UPF0104 family)
MNGDDTSGVTAATPTASEPSGVAWVFVATDDVRARRPADVVTLGLGVTLVLLTAFQSAQIGWIESLVVDAVEAFPSWLDGLLEATYAIAALYALLLMVLALVAGKSERGTLRDLLLAAGLSFVAGTGLSWLVAGDWPVLFPEFVGELEAQYPIMRIALVTSVLITAAPHLVRPLRRFGWLIGFGVVVAGIAIGLGEPTDAFGALGVGVAAAGIVLIAFGSPRGYPDPTTVVTGLEQLNVSVSALTTAPHQTWGVRRFAAANSDGAPLVVKVYGRDARDAQLLARVWRALWYRDAGPALTSSRLHQVEHEAFLTIMAGRAAVTTPTVVTAGAPTKELALVVLADAGVPLGAGTEGISDDLLASVWHQAALLHEAGIAHGRLNLLSIGVAGAQPIIGNFRESSAGAPEERIQADTAELLLTMADRFGVDRTVTAARTGIGDEGLIAAMPYLQAPAVSSEGRSDVSHVRTLFSELREEIGARTNTDTPKRVPLTRVTGRTLLMFGLTLLAGYALVGMLAGIDFASVWGELEDANWGWVAAAFVVAQLPLLSEATTMMAAVAQPIPFMPTMQLQSAIKFIQLAIGGAAGRMATNIAYLRKFGVSTPDAVTQGAVDSLTGFFIQILIILAAIVFGGIRLLPDDVSGDINWAMVLGLVVFAVVVSALVLRFVRPIRERVVPAVREAWEGLSALVRDPGRFLTLLGAVIVTQLIYAFALWLTALAFGWVVPLSSMLVINTIAALFAGLLPIPGGVGVTEALLTAGLTAVGIDESAAFAIAVTYRVLSAYLPPVWGWFSLQWLERNGYL